MRTLRAPTSLGFGLVLALLVACGGQPAEPTRAPAPASTAQASPIGPASDPVSTSPSPLAVATVAAVSSPSPAAAASPAASPAVAAASPSPSPAAVPSPVAVRPATGGPRERVKVAIGSQASLAYLSFDLAKALGYYDEEGIDPELQYFSGGTEAATAILSGSVEFSGNSLDHPIRAQAQGKDLEMVASITRLPGVALVVRKDLEGEVKTVADLRGRKVGVTSLGAGTHVLANYLLTQAGIPKPEVDANIVAVGSATMPAALEKGDVPAAIGNDPYVTRLVQDGKAFVLVDFRTPEDTQKYLGGDFQFTGLLVMAEYAQKYPQTVQKMVNAIVRANRYIAENNPEDIASKLPREFTGNDVQGFIVSLAASKPAFSTDGKISLLGVENVIKVNRAFGSIRPGQDVDANRLFDNSFADKVPR